MAPATRSLRAERARTELALMRGLAGMVAGVVALVATTGAAIGPAESAIDLVPRSIEAKASLSFAGTDPVITGSVDHMFMGASFVGPNRSAKTDRARYVPPVLEFVKGFDSLRSKLLAARTPASVAPLPAKPAIAVAALAPGAHSQALDAIDSLTNPGAAGVAIGPAAPIPATLSDKLAYARAETPATVFGVGTGTKVTDREMWCLATAIYFEARGESYRGQIGVAQVVLNRMKHRLYPDTMCGVVFQNQHKRNACQFSFACDGIPEHVTDQKSWKQAQEIAKGVVRGDLYLSEVGHATHYHATYVSPHWAPRMQRVTKIGLHVFYQFKRGWKFG